MIDLKKLREFASCGEAVNHNVVLELLDMLEATQKDAARYQWLRKWKGQEHEPPFTVQHEVDGTVWGGDLDYAIDAAMQS